MKPNKFKILVIALAAISTIVFSNSYSWADVIFSDFGPADTYIEGIGYTLSVGSPIGSDYDQGNAFTPVGTYSLDTIKLAVWLQEGPNELDVWLMSDAGGEPGAIIESFHFSDAMEQGAYHVPSAPVLVANSLLHPVLSANTQYWLIASAPGPDEEAAWNWNLLDISGKRASREDMGTWYLFDNTPVTMAAFSVTGTPIPEPTTMLLLGSGLLGLWGFRRKFRK